MHLAILGATGRTGRHLVDQAIVAGHRVTAVVRDPNRFDQNQSGLAVRPLSTLTAEALAPLLTGTDAVLSTIGTRDSRKPTTVTADTATATVAAMRASGTRRLVVVSASGMHREGDDPLTRLLVKPVLGRILRHAFADMLRMEEIVARSGLDWTLLRPPRLTDRPAAGSYRTALDRNVRGGFQLTRADLAACLLRCLHEPAWSRHAVSVAH
ncbi:NAD(P)H-binding protein [Micromonospora sp. WMMD1082]|uniref:NAD(P)-dependent oxidoreductase n=1 Tax=Micromonospora sp. WMMD1082 TaxID=3016104 RepID=UPI002415B268|nr:NAD(P)H-binding protein [Micromonospora sp. WMMD1082]MDG4797589.1 NAD(P)H-binding protein [Micromonospora sp. WMMD1082]